MISKKMWGISPDGKRVICAKTFPLGKTTVYIAKLTGDKVSEFTKIKAKKSDLVEGTLILDGVTSKETTFGYIIRQTDLWKPFKKFIKNVPEQADYLDIQDNL